MPGTSLWRDCRGAGAVEFALISPILIGLLIGAAEFGLLLYTQNAMQQAVRDGARQIAVGRMADDKAPAYLCGSLPGWARTACKADVVHSNRANPALNIVTVNASVPASEASVISFFIPIIGDFPLRASASMRWEDV